MKSILLIEDDEDLRTLVVMMLEGQGYAVEAAENGAEGLVRARRSIPDLILLDMTMPVMSGPEFAKVYRASESCRVPIVVLTAADHASRRSHEIDADDFLAKPFAFEELVGVVRKNLHEPEHPAVQGAG